MTARHRAEETRAKERAAVVRAIRRRKSLGLSLWCRAVRVEDRDLELAAARCFQNWGNALRVAGLNADVVARRRKWTAEQVVARIRDLSRQGAPLNHGAVGKVDQGLTGAAMKLLGSWDNALRAAGFDPSVIRVCRGPWARSEIIKIIQTRVTVQSPMSQRRLVPASTVSAIKRLFGPFKVALRQAGVLHLGKPYYRWSRPVVLKAIHDRVRGDQPINCLAVAKDDPNLYEAACRHLGGWHEALRVAGFDPNRIRRKPPPWTAQSVLDEIRRRVAAGEPPAVCISAIRPESLVRGCRRFFGSWHEAVIAAQLDKMRPDNRGRRRGNGAASAHSWIQLAISCIAHRWISGRDEVLEAIRKRQRDGLPLNRMAVFWSHRSLDNAILRVFGSWDRAMQAAGIDPDGVRLHRRWSREKVIAELCQRAERGHSLCSFAVQKSDKSLAHAARHWFSSWNDALRCAGFDPEKHRERGPRWTCERVVRIIQDIHAGGGKVNGKAFASQSIVIAGAQLFGSWDAALFAAGFDPLKIRELRRPWTPDELLQEIQRKHHAGEPLNGRQVLPSTLYIRGRSFFGSWDAALTAAGLDPATVRKGAARKGTAK